MPSETEWRLYAHPLFLEQLGRLLESVARERRKNPKGYQQGANAKLLAQMRKLVWETIPSDPRRSEYRQGSTLGATRRHWFRAKFGGGRFRLFFRFDTRARIIVYAWVNDSETLRTYGARTDAYAVFCRMLDAGNPSEAWTDLLAQTTALERSKGDEL